MSVGYIYALADPNNPKLPRYIGKTTRPLRQRLKNHKQSCKERPQYPLHQWLTSLYSSGLRPDIYLLETTDRDSLKDREVHWIRFFRPLGSLLNQSDGDGSLGMGNPWSVRPVESEDGRFWFGSITLAARAIGTDVASLHKSINKAWCCRGVKWKYSNKKQGDAPDLTALSEVLTLPCFRQRKPLLTPAQHLEMKSLWAEGHLCQTEIAQRFGVTQSHVSKTIKRLTSKSTLHHA